MNTRQVVRKLEAFRAGHPLPRGETLHVHVGERSDTLLLAFLRMGGESSPWAIGWGFPGQQPVVHTVPEPRNRDLVADMVAAFAPTLLSHLRHPDYCDDRTSGPNDPMPLRQVWLPNPSHLDMLHHLAYAYTFTKWGTPSRVTLLNAVGRAAGWLFREACRPGQMSVMVATDALTQCHTFPAETARQGHLGYLMAWLETQGDLDARMTAAAAAEQRSVSVNLEPQFERDTLVRLVDGWNDAFRCDDSRRTEVLAKQVDGELVPEVNRRLRLVEKTIRTLRDDARRPNFGLRALVDASKSEHWYQYLRIERAVDAEDDGPAFSPSPETDRYPAAAASRFFVCEDSEELRLSALIHHDHDVLDEAIADGEAIRATITAVVDERPTPRTMQPVWTLEGDGTGPLRLREGTAICVAGIPKRTGTLRSVGPLPGGMRRYEVEIDGWKKAQRLPNRQSILAANSQDLVGSEVILLKSGAIGLARLKSQRVWGRQGPGAWLTHGVPTGPRADLPPEIAEDVRAIYDADHAEEPE